MHIQLNPVYMPPFYTHVQHSFQPLQNIELIPKLYMHENSRIKCVQYKCAKHIIATMYIRYKRIRLYV